VGPDCKGRFKFGRSNNGPDPRRRKTKPGAQKKKGRKPGQKNRETDPFTTSPHAAAPK